MTQTALRQPARFEGTGLHSGAPVRLTVSPAAPGSGIRFVRTDLGGASVPGRFDRVEETPLMTRLVAEDGTSVATVEHLMAACAGLGLRDLVIELDGPEVPVLDGSSAPFVAGLRRAGLVRAPGPVRAWRLKRSVEVRRGDAVARLDPFDGLALHFTIVFEDAAIGRQSLSVDLAGTAFERELASARTFCRRADIEGMQAAGFALGGSYDNAVVVDGAQVLSPGGWRMRQEAVRHKMLDALGDLSLAGLPILARYTGRKSGHSLTNALLRAAFATPGAMKQVICPPALEMRLPGASVPVSETRAVA